MQNSDKLTFSLNTWANKQLKSISLINFIVNAAIIIIKLWVKN